MCPTYSRKGTTVSRLKDTAVSFLAKGYSCKIANNLYQYTAIDDCTRYKVLALYKRRTTANTLDFLDQAMERMPFPIQRIQTDREQEFFAYEVQERLKEYTSIRDKRV